MGAPKIEELRSLTDEELVKRHDDISTHTAVGTAYYLDELNRRTQEKHAKSIKNLTIWIAIMTGVMTICTILNAIFIIKFY